MRTDWTRSGREAFNAGEKRTGSVSLGRTLGIAFGGMLEVGDETRHQVRDTETMNTTKSYEEIIDFIAAGTTPEAVVAFHPSDSVQQRVAELVGRSKDGSISADDQSELEDYLQLEHIMIMAKARARQHTQLGQ
jgi:hypothetical protein